MGLHVQQNILCSKKSFNKLLLTFKVTLANTSCQTIKNIKLRIKSSVWGTTVCYRKVTIDENCDTIIPYCDSDNFSLNIKGDLLSKESYLEPKSKCCFNVTLCIVYFDFWSDYFQELIVTGCKSKKKIWNYSNSNRLCNKKCYC